MALLARGKVRLWAMVVAVVTASSLASAAGSELTEREIADLQAGQMVVRADDVERGGRRYIGGVSYIMIDAPPEQVIDVLDDVRTYRDILPRTRSVRWLGIARDGDSIVELEQGNAMAHGKYTVRIRRDRTDRDSSSAIIRFWLDPRFSHNIADASGFFQIEAVGEKTRLTYLVMVDLGSGFWGQMFEGRIRRAALSTPLLVKKYVESHPPAPAS
ncbi:MAG TPA: SRPBCC family protein [Polyangiaceae bacterium]|nr:SRPBCC family protein [Polyangiaceae bacterium]